MPATSLTVILGASGSGDQDANLLDDGQIVFADLDIGDNTVSTGALAFLAATKNIIVQATSTITFNDLGSSTLTLQTGAGNSAVFSTAIAGGGAISFAIETNTLATSGGNLEFTARTNLTLANLSAPGGAIFVSADDMAVRGHINAPFVRLQPWTTARNIDLGTNSAGSLGLTDAELDQVTANTLQIGRADNPVNIANPGNIAITDSISWGANTTLVLWLRSLTTISQNTGTTVTAGNLLMEALDGISLATGSTTQADAALTLKPGNSSEADANGSTSSLLGTLTAGAMAPIVLGGKGADSVTVGLANNERLSVYLGSGNDTLAFADGGSLNGGTFDGGEGIDTLDYSAYTTPVAANLGLRSTGLSATLEGRQEVPAQPTTAQATATITYNYVAHIFDITLSVSGISPTDTQLRFHIHRAVSGVNGPIIVDLFSATAVTNVGTLTQTGPTSFTYTATGVPLNPLDEAALLGGLTYLNIHTNAFPDGEIRGQIFPNALFAADSGTATGTYAIENVENVIGGSGNDGLIGNFVANTLTGNGGDDILLGGPGSDIFVGGNNDDIMVWSNGDGTAIMDGGAGSDLVNVNGNVTANDVFAICSNGTGVALQLTSPGPFSLDIGTVESLMVNGIGGQDSFIVNSLAGVADLTTINLNGLADNDAFTVLPDANVAVNVNGGAPSLPTTPGDGLNYLGSGTVTSTGAGAGTITTSGMQPVTFVDFETLGTSTPIITANPSNQTITVGRTAFFTVAAISSSALTVQWQVSSNGGATWSNLSNGGNFSGVTTTTLTVSQAQTNLNGLQFRAVFTTTTDHVSKATAAATLTINLGYAYIAYANAYNAYVYAYYAYTTSGGNTNAYLAYANATVAYVYSSYANYFSSIGQTALAAYYAGSSQYYSYAAAYFSSQVYAATGNSYAYSAWYLAAYSYYYSDNVRAGH